MKKYMNIKEFVDSGFLQEINRQFLHPLGLAIQVSQSGSEWKLDKIIDCRDNPEETIFNKLEESKILNFAEIKKSQEQKRFEKLGYVIQDMPVDLVK